MTLVILADSEFTRSRSVQLLSLTLQPTISTQTSTRPTQTFTFMIHCSQLEEWRVSTDEKHTHTLTNVSHEITLPHHDFHSLLQPQKDPKPQDPLCVTYSFLVTLFTTTSPLLFLFKSLGEREWVSQKDPSRHRVLCFQVCVCGLACLHPHFPPPSLPVLFFLKLDISFSWWGRWNHSRGRV